MPPRAAWARDGARSVHVALPARRGLATLVVALAVGLAAGAVRAAPAAPQDAPQRYALPGAAPASPPPAPPALGTPHLGSGTRRVPVPAAPVYARSVIDWQHRQVVVQAEARPPGPARLWRDVAALAQSLAERAIVREVVDVLQSLPLGADFGEPKSFLAAHPAWAAHLEQAARAFVTDVSVYDADGRVALRAEVPLDGEGTQLGALWAALVATRGPLGTAAAPLAPAQVTLLPPQRGAKAAVAPTGVVVLARGLKFVPSLFPRLFDEAGRELYGPATLDADALARRGVATLHDAAQEALRDPRVAEHARTVRAIATAGAARTDLVLSAADAAELRALAPLLRQGRVALVVDLPPLLPDAGDCVDGCGR